MISGHIIELTSMYKQGHQNLKCRMAIEGRSIVRIEEVPEDVPEHDDGHRTRIELISGAIIGLQDDYNEVLRMWNEGLTDL